MSLSKNFLRVIQIVESLDVNSEESKIIRYLLEQGYTEEEHTILGGMFNTYKKDGSGSVIVYPQSKNTVGWELLTKNVFGYEEKPAIADTGDTLDELKLGIERNL